MGQAQFDLGASIGAYHYSLHGKESEGHEYARFNDTSNPGLTASIFYRERCAAFTDLGVEIQYTRKSFNTYYSSGSLAGSTGATGDVELHLLHLSITPEVRLNTKRTAVVRFGPQFGFLVASSMTGYMWNSYPYQWSRTDFQSSRASDFSGDIRFLFGLGFRSNANAPFAMTFDPYLSASITSLLHHAPGAFGAEYGLKIGLVRRSKGSTLSQWIHASTPTQPPGPNW